MKHLRKILEGFNDSNGNLLRGSTNLSVDKIYSIIALRMSVFFSLANNVLSYNIVANLQSILFKVLRKVYRSSLNLGQRRRKCEVDSISKPQLQIGFKQS